MYQCKMCSRKCKANELRRHTKVYHKHQKLSFECTLCGKMYRDEDQKKITPEYVRAHEARHKKEMQKKGSFKCNGCPKSYNEKSQLREHVRIHDKPFQCKSCMKEFFTMKSIKRHTEKNVC